MTVKELIEILQKFDPNLPVTRDAIDGEGSGVRAIYDVSSIRAPTGPWDHDIMDVVLIS